MKKAMMFLFLIIGIYACESDENLILEPGTVMKTGVVEPQGITNYMYGSYVLIMEGEHFVLKSDVYDLDDYISEEVTVIGTTSAGSVSYGPDIINVVEIK